MNRTLNILICDDDRIDIKILKSSLKKISNHNFEIHDAVSKDEIENSLNEKGKFWDLIFLDYNMPLKSGIEWLREIVEMDIAPVIMLTGFGDEKTAVDLMKNGAFDYIPKGSLNVYSLEKSINNTLEKWAIQKERNALLGIAAHELRNPITTIMGYAEILKDYSDIEAEKRNEIYSVIQERSEHLLEIINKLLDITRIDNGKITLEKIESDLVKFCENKVAEFNLRGKNKNILISFNTNKTDINYCFDPQRFDEVISNLLDNALKFSHVNSSIDFQIEETDSEIKIEIADKGQGIKHEELQYLFDLFSNTKISSRPTGEEKSTGLGLAICKKIVTMHDGVIMVESEPGKGTNFIVKLPL
ncbi:MAG: response regulator [Melioribacteraceae bacterium]|nr:response regulator [Melioribacteraceae bacterium]MCF8432343.1 response regulator [Melioribacteraceae bacterium]